MENRTVLALSLISFGISFSLIFSLLEMSKHKNVESHCYSLKEDCNVCTN